MPLKSNSQLQETQIKIFRKDDRYHVLLQHADGREELSHQSYPTRQACEAAIQQYVKDRDAQLRRVQ